MNSPSVKFPISSFEGAVLGLLRDEETREYRVGIQEQDVDVAFDTMLAALPVDASKDELEQLRRHILVLVGADIPIGRPPVTDHHKPWLNDIKTEINWRRWHAYREMLAKSGRSPLVLQKLDQFTDTVLDLVGNPRADGRWNRRGLLIGDVQSGKTQNYVALMNKAVDAGFRLIIVLSGNTEYLRRQTQERVDEGFIGRDTSGAAKIGNSQVSKNPYVGIGKLDPSVANATSMTTVLLDYLDMTKRGTSIPMPTDSSAPLVFVVKKNKFVLDAVDGWAKDQAGDEKIGFPLLLLDDESDYASVNTRDSDNPTAINTAIRRILSRFARSSYLAITATPFANVFIDDSAVYSSDGEELPDLFPQDYIFPLEAPTNYVGIQSVFGDSEKEYPDGLILLEDADSWIPLKHKKDLDVPPLPESLLAAIRTFILANALMDLRIKMPRRRSMLINVSRFTNVQNSVADLVSSELYKLKSAIELHSQTYAQGRDNAVLDSLRKTFEEEFSNVSADWQDVLGTLHTSAAPIQVQVYNSSETDEESEVISSQNPDRQIAIGGDLLSRGLTLEGLVVSYFHRSVGAADTMMQMARWFGYRDGYRDLCRLWISERTVRDYQYIQEAVTELRDDLDQMQRTGLTPRDFGIAIRQHPESLLITARNKARTGVIDSTETVELSLLGRNLETRKLSANRVDVDRNRKSVSEFVERAATAGYEPSETARGYNVYRDIPKTWIADLLEKYRPGREDVFFGAAGSSGSGLAATVRSSQAEIFQNWDVTFVNGAKNTPPLETLVPNKKVFPVARNLEPKKGFDNSGQFQSLWVSGQKTRVAGSDDLRKLLSTADETRAVAEYTAEHPNPAKSVPESWFYRYLPRPQLLIYPLVPSNLSEDPETRQELRDAWGDSVYEVLAEAAENEPLFALKVALPINAREIKAKSGVAKYMLNTVAQKFRLAEYEELATARIEAG